MLRIYIIGVFILFIAIICNVIAEKIGIITWYDFGPELYNNGFSIFKIIGFANCIWLFIIYPLLLASGYIVGNRFFKFIS